MKSLVRKAYDVAWQRPNRHRSRPPPQAHSTIDWCHLRFFERQVLLADDEPSRFLQEYVGRIEWEDPENSSVRVGMGSFRAFLVDLVGAITEDKSVYQVFDTTQSTWCVFEALFDMDTEGLTDATKKAAFGNGVA